MYPHQAERLTAAVERHGLDALVAVSAENVRYVTGFASAVESAYRDHRVFGLFTRGSTGADSPGVGVGLSLVAQFAALHGGRAWVEDNPGGGASFRVLLPGAFR